MERYERVQVSEDVTIIEALRAIDEGACGMCCIVDGSRRLIGVLTDGDLRRGLLAGASVEDRALPFASTTPRTVSTHMDRAHVLDLLRSLGIATIPVLDPDGRLTGLHTLSAILGADDLPNPAVIMAGGRGTRLGAHTADTPKPLMNVAGRSILEWLVLGLAGDGVRDITVAVNYLADRIVERLGDGSDLGCTISYIHEEPESPLGTAGSLAAFRGSRPDLADPVLVLNGDLMVQFDAASLLQHHRACGAAITCAVRPYEHTIPFGVVSLGPGDRVVAIEEKPTLSRPINSAIYAVEPGILDRVPAGRASTMPDLIDSCLSTGEVVSAWQLTSDWIDIGTPSDLARAKGLLA